MNKCPECGKFLKNVTAKCRRWDDKIFVTGTCKTHGSVAPIDWVADDFQWDDDSKIGDVTDACEFQDFEIAWAQR